MFFRTKFSVMKLILTAKFFGQSFWWWRAKLKTKVCAFHNLTVTQNSTLRNWWRWLHCSRYHISQHCWSKWRTSGCSPSSFRPLCLLSMCFSRIPRHSLGSFTATVLQSLLYLWHSWLHLRERCSCLPKLLHLCEKTSEWPTECYNSSRSKWPLPKHRYSDPQLTNQDSAWSREGGQFSPDLFRTALVPILENGLHENIYEFSGKSFRLVDVGHF